MIRRIFALYNILIDFSIHTLNVRIFNLLPYLFRCLMMMQQTDNNSLVKRVYTSIWKSIQLIVKNVVVCDNRNVDIFFETNEPSTKKERSALGCCCIVFHFVIDMSTMMTHNLILDCQQLFNSQFVFFNLFPNRFQLIQFQMRARVCDYQSHCRFVLATHKKYSQSIKIENNKIDTKFQSLKSEIRHMPKIKLNCSGKWN